MNAAPGPLTAPLDRARSASRLPWVLAWAAVMVFYVWTARSDNVSWRFGEEQTDYYNLLVDGFLEGRLSLKAEVPRELLAVANPYDPAQRPAGIALHDASLYRGRYYIYYGVVPAVVLLLPFRLLTSVDLPLAAAVLVFVAGGYTLALAILAGIRARFFPRVGAIWTATLGMALGITSCTVFLLRRSSMYDLPIASGFCFAMAALFFLVRLTLRPERGALWLAAASACCGLAIGSRPTYLLVAGVPVLAGLVLGWRERGAGVGTLFRRFLVPAVVPLAAIGLLLAAYNFARFGDPREFGVRYILSGVYEAEVEHFRFRYVAWNAFAYFAAPTEWTRAFPFLQPEAIAVPLPRQHFGMDFPFGLLPHLPFLLLTAGVAMPWIQRTRAERAQLGLIVVALAAFAAGPLALVLFFYAAMARYLVDFVPALALLASMGTLAAIDALGTARWRRLVFAAAGGALVAYSVATVLLFSVRIYDRVRAFNPRTYHALARVFNAPVHWLERWRQEPRGPLSLELRFPVEAAGGRVEQLVATGVGGDTDRVFVVYPDLEHVVLAYEHAGARRVMGQPVALDRTRSHHVRVWLGSLFPAESDPSIARLPARQRDSLLRRVRLEVNGTAVLDRYQRSHPADATDLMLGGEGEEKFTGQVLAVARTPLEELLAREVVPALPPHERTIKADARGAVRLMVRFPPGKAGEREPLLVSGETGRGNFLAVEYLEAGRLRFVFEHWGRRPYFGPPMSYVAGRDHLVVITHPFYAGLERSRARVGDGELTIDVDGRRVWTERPLFYPMEQSDVFLGYDPIGASGAARFGGSLVIP